MAKNDKQYVVNWTLQGHRGKDYAAGDTLRASDEEAAPLLACGVLSAEGEQADARDDAGESGEQEAGESAGE